MIITLTVIVSFITAFWGWELIVNGPGSASLPWIIYTQGLFLSGLLSISLMSISMVLATRPVWLEKPLGGMDRIYRLHKWTGILGIGFAAMHWLIEMSDDFIKSAFGRGGRPLKEEFIGLFRGLRHTAEGLGEFAIYIILAMLVLALWKRFPYKFWRHIHRVMPILFLMVAFHSAVLAPADYWIQPIGMLLAILLSAGSVSALMSLSGRIGHGRKTSGTVISVFSSASDITEITCSLDGNWRGHRSGQFAFVSFDRYEGAHPFTIASADQGNRSITFQIKALGDYTRQLVQRVQTGQPVVVEGPYGCFDLVRRNPRAKQIWIAGGIGITPFLARLEELRNDPAQTAEAELHYCSRHQNEDPLASRLEALCKNLTGITLHIHDAYRRDMLDANRLTTMYDPEQPAEIWFCGPGNFAKQLKNDLSGIWKGRFRFHQEAFEMR